MRVVRHLSRCGRARAPIVLTLGNFDGVHLGHHAILERVRTEARRRDGEAVVFTFHPHPVAVLAPAHAPARLQSLADRLRLFRAVGIDTAVVQRFTRDFARLEAEDFVERVLLPALPVAHVVVGHRVSFGRQRRGNVDVLRALGRRHGFAVESIGPVEVAGHEVSSTAVRALLEGGEMATVRRLLGRAWTLRGRVVPGDRRGRTLGFPTANLRPRAGLVLPPDGVYAARVEVAGRMHAAVVNLGVRPTFTPGRRLLEVHLLDFDGDLYGAWLTVALVAFVRPERRFDGREALRAGITADVERVRAMLADDVGVPE